MRQAAEKGHTNLVELFIEKVSTNSLNATLWAAAKGGHRDIVDLFIQKGADDWDSGLRQAAQIGDTELTKLFIDKGATNFLIALELHLSERPINVEIVRLLHKHGAFKRSNIDQILFRYERAHQKSTYQMASNYCVLKQEFRELRK